MPKPTRQLLRALVSRGLGSTEREAIAFLRCLRAIDHGADPIGALMRSDLTQTRRGEIAAAATSWRAR